ncbi:MAG: recombinase family protein [Defluviitaleaceae bacterium]|nr:recombinase family protein [Defluviitaleaceae bacterium]
MKNAVTNVVLYARMSTDKQENSIESQCVVLENYAKAHGMLVVDRYVDEGLSGRDAASRPAFMKMIDDSRNGDFDGVLVYDSSRFARNLEESIVYKSVLNKNGVALISATEPRLDDDSALITDAMLGALNELHSRKLSKAVKRGMVHAAQKGFHQTPPPYGYSKQNGVLQINEQEAAVVRMIFEMFIDLPSWHSVAAKLNDMGISKRKAYGWYSRDIKRMLTNSTYIGFVNYAGNVYNGKHDSIVDNEIWDKVKILIENKPTYQSRSSNTYKHWLSGLLKCGVCGGRLNHSTDKRGNRFYRCSKYANGACNYSNFIAVKKMEDLLIASFDDIMMGDMTGARFSPRVDCKKQIDLLNATLKKVQARLARHKEAYANGVDSLEEYSENRERCRKEEENILSEIKKHESHEVDVHSLKNKIQEVRGVLFSGDTILEHKSHAIKSIIEKIVKYRSEVTIYYFV